MVGYFLCVDCMIVYALLWVGVDYGFNSKQWQVADAEGKWQQQKASGLSRSLLSSDSDAPIGTCEAKLQPVPTSASRGEGERGERE